MSDEHAPKLNLSEDEAITLAEGIRWENPEGAIYTLEDYLETDPVSLRVRLLLAALYAEDRGLGIAGAERVYREILQDYPDNITAMNGLALLQGHPHSSVQPHESVDLLRRAATLSEDPDLIRNFATKAWEIGHLDQAAEGFQWLKKAAVGPRAHYFKLIAATALEAIREGNAPSKFIYNWPE